MKTGDKVVCVQTVTTRRAKITGAVKGKIYEVKDILTCSCGNRGFYVGIDIPANIDIFYSTCRCGKKYLTTRKWWHPERVFVPIIWNDCREELIEEVMETKIEVETIKEPQL